MEEKAHGLNQSMSDKAVYRTAPATPGLLKEEEKKWTKWWSLLVEGLLSTGPTPSSFIFIRLNWTLLIHRPGVAVLFYKHLWHWLIYDPFHLNLHKIITPKLKKLGNWKFERMFVPYNMSHVMCHMSHVTYHVSHVKCHVSHVTCHVSHVMCHLSCVTCHM